MQRSRQTLAALPAQSSLCLVDHSSLCILQGPRARAWPATAPQAPGQFSLQSLASSSSQAPDLPPHSILTDDPASCFTEKIEAIRREIPLPLFISSDNLPPSPARTRAEGQGPTSASGVPLAQQAQRLCSCSSPPSLHQRPSLQGHFHQLLFFESPSLTLTSLWPLCRFLSGCTESP